MLTLKRTTSDHTDFIELVAHLDAYLRIMDGAEHFFYAQYNKIDKLRQVVLCYSGDTAIGCGAFKEYGEDTVEIKRMFVLPEFRGKGAAAAILKELEIWATELNYSKAVLETGRKQLEAIGLYQKLGYSLIPNYGQYENIENSICMKKTIQ